MQFYHFHFACFSFAITFVAGKEKPTDNNINHRKTYKISRYVNHNKVSTQQSAQFLYWLDEWSAIDFANFSHVEVMNHLVCPFSLIASSQKAAEEQLKLHKNKEHLHYL